ncbi:hypothetical protein PVW46_19780 [Mameliella sp. AT18]|uniref:hypothetical protein n=1 Tax=Mameliella sp. AT18 TaxID=3028385 RepID=UPI00237B1459|nr:hypothetical protein [Mameliella sp. AT18]MDD9732146.1 hypothetical protein [Mameliella sp. AT18]
MTPFFLSALFAASLSFATLPSFAAAQQMLSDGQEIVATFSKGPFSSFQGRYGTGKVGFTYRKSSNTLGPASILSHTGNKIVARGTSTTCTFRKNASVSCKNGSRGVWQLAK